MHDTTHNHTITVSTGTILRVLLLFLLIWFLYVVRDAVLLVVVSGVLAAALDPFVSDLEKLYMPRWAGVLFIYIIAFGVFAGSIYLVVPPFIEQVQNLSHNVPQFGQEINLRLASIQGSIGGNYISQDTIMQVTQGFASKISGLTGDVFGVATSILGALVTGLLVLALSFYLLVERHALKTFAGDLVPKHYEAQFISATREIKVRIGRWFKGQLFLSLTIFALVLISLEILGIKYALTFAIIAGVTEAIPYLGPVLGGIPAVLITLMVNPVKAVLVLIVYVVIQELEGHVIVPKVMERSVGLNPVIIVIAIMLGLRLAGVVGVLLAIPLAIVASVIIKGSLSQPAVK